MDKMYPGRFTDVILDLVLSNLPLKIDAYEESLCFTYLEELMKSNTDLVLSHLQRVCSVFAEYLKGDVEEEEVLVCIESLCIGIEFDWAASGVFEEPLFARIQQCSFRNG